MLIGGGKQHQLRVKTISAYPQIFSFSYQCQFSKPNIFIPLCPLPVERALKVGHILPAPHDDAGDVAIVQ
jgi:hypothetical protein